MYIVARPVIAARRIARSGFVVVSAAWPNLILAIPLVVIIVDLTRRDGLHFQVFFAPAAYTMRPDFGAPLSSDGWVAEFAITMVVLTLLMLLLLIVFGRGSHRRRWGQKPPEIEVATRYFMG